MQFLRNSIPLWQCICLAIILSALVGYFAAKDTERGRTLRSIGYLIAERDTTRSHKHQYDAFGAGPVSSEFKRIYEDSIAKFGCENRVDYFWSSMWHIGFQGGPLNLFLDTVDSDSCLPAFMKRLRNYLDTAKKIGRTGGFFQESEFMLRRLEHRIKLSGSSAD